jgi:SAM-dependent methyltransferase
MNTFFSRRFWNRHAREDGLWAALTWEEKSGRRWSPGDFFSIGREEVDRVLGELRSAGIEVVCGRALDFGCGPGRVSQGLARHFAQVDGVDISERMVMLATGHNRFPEQCRYHHNPSRQLALFDDNVFDFVYSIITLQHIPPANVLRYLREFLRVARSGGLIIVQIPDRPIGVSTGGRIRGALDRALPTSLVALARECKHFVTGRMPIYGTPRIDVVRTVKESGGQVVTVAGDSASGPGWVGYRYIIKKT